VVTKRPAGVDLELFAPTGSVPLGRIADLGSEREVIAHKDGMDIVHLRFTKTAQVNAPKLRALLDEVR
jgi:hypothetical protein